METLYKENAKIVYHYLYSRCKDEELSKDLTQETFLKAYESMERFDGSYKISTWLCQIAKHLLYRHWEKDPLLTTLSVHEKTLEAAETKDSDEGLFIEGILELARRLGIEA